MTYGFALFPGQGAQHPGMARACLRAARPHARFSPAHPTLPDSTWAKLCFEGTQEELSRTVNSQVAIFTHSMAALAALREAGVSFEACAGFSLGEYTALAASGIVSLEDGVRIVRKRGQVMRAAADAMDSGMARPSSGWTTRLSSRRAPK